MEDAVAIGISATLTNARNVHEMLSSVMTGTGPVIIDVAGLQACDLSFVQLVEAFRRDAEARDVEVRLSGPSPECVRRVLRNAGFITPESTAANAFWLQGESLQ